MQYDQSVFFDISTDLLCIISTDGHFKRINPAFERALGWKTAELPNQSFFSFIHPDDLNATTEEIGKLGSKIKTTSFKNRYRCRAGTYLSLDWTIIVDSESDFFYATAHDRTVLRSAGEMFRLVIEASPTALILTDTDGKMTIVNKLVEIYFGYTRQELIGQPVEMLMPTSSNMKHLEQRAAFYKRPEARSMGSGRELHGMQKNGTEFPVEIGLSPIEIDERLFVVVAILDITRRKMVEGTLCHAKEEAEKANRLKSEFLNLMSHELRTPLTVMLGNLPLLKDASDMPEADEIVEIAQDVEESGEHLLTLINDLLDISKIEAGHLQLHPEVINVDDLVQNIASTVQTLAVEKKLSIDVEVENCEINADRVRMKQILLNLLSNAVKFTNQGGIVLKVYPQNAHVFFEVQDTGCGINKQDLPLLFNMFRQLDNSSTRKATGSGLGLVITKRLIEMHGGKINVESAPDQGSTFKFFIPVIHS